MLSYTSHSQIYHHNFGTTTINTHPYTVPPLVIDPNLSDSSWDNSTAGWTSNTGAAGQAITLYNSSGTTTITLTLTIAPNFEANITWFNFWRQRSNSGPQNWQISINGIEAGNGTIPTTGAATGVTSVTNPVTGLTGNVTVTLTMSGALGNGNMRLDDFILYGNVVSNCDSVEIDSFSPQTGPENTLVTIIGSGFNSAASVKFDDIEAVYVPVSDTEISALVPAGTTGGTISVTASDGCEAETVTPFTILTSDCEGTAEEIYISEIYDHTPGSYGMIELYNPTDETITFNGQYTLERAGDIGGAPSYSLILPGSIAPGMTYLVRSYGTGVIGCNVTADTDMGQGINANDEFKLFKSGSLIDIARAPSFVGYTVIRVPDAVAPSLVYNGADWYVSSNNCSNLGIHNAVPTALPIPDITGPNVQAACENNIVSFNVSLPTPDECTYQWKTLNNAGVWVNVNDDTNYSGATTSMLTITNIPAEFNNDQYYCEITSETCDIISVAAQLYVNPSPQTPDVTVSEPDCSTPTGSITVTSTTTPGLTYSIDGVNYSAANEFAGLEPDTYTITAKNVEGCVSEPATVIINEPTDAPEEPEMTITQPTCTEPSGTITVTSPTGTGLQYSIGNGYQDENIFENLSPGEYDITVQDAGGCTSNTVSVTIDNVLDIPGIPNFTVTQPDCDAPNGTIQITSPLGNGFEYSINGQDYQASPVFSGLDPDTYTITVQNADGCISAPVTQEINAIPDLPEDAVVTTTQPDCDTATGTIEITSPLVGGLTYSIDGENYQSSAIFNGLPSGIYSVTVQGAPGCISQPVQVTVNDAPAQPNIPQITAVQPDCTTNAGSITVTSPIENGLLYSIDGVNYQPENIFNNLPPDTYTITVQNQVGCISSPVVQVINTIPNAPASPNLDISQPDCTTDTGSITVTAPTGQGITYSINGIDYQNTSVFNNLTSGNYTLTVQNAQGCISPVSTATINQAPAVPNAPQVTAVQPDCTTATGTITITTPTGNGLLYSIDGVNYQTQTVFNDVAANTYTVTVKNAQGCISQGTEQVINNAPATPDLPTVTVLQPDCDTATGTIEIESPVGNSFSYSIDNGLTYQPEAVFENLSPGSYTIRVQNNSGCTNESLPVTINSPPPSAPDAGTLTGNNEVCILGTTQLTASVNNGTWSSSNPAIAIVNGDGLVTTLSAGTVTINYTVGTGCTNYSSIAVTIFPLPNPSLEDIYYICRDTTSGETSAVILDSGLPEEDYSFEWSIGGVVLPDTSGEITVSEPGQYNLSVTNILTGCEITVSATVAVSSPAIATAEVRYDFNSNQSIHINVTGGSGDYEYSIDGIFFQESPVFTGITEGEYTVIVRDRNGCDDIELSVFALNYPRFFSPNGDGLRDTWNIKGLRNQPDSYIYIYDRYGKLMATVRPSGMGWDGTFNGARMPATDYWFTVNYTSSNGNKKEFKAHFSLLR